MELAENATDAREGTLLAHGSRTWALLLTRYRLLRALAASARCARREFIYS